MKQFAIVVFVELEESSPLASRVTEVQWWGRKKTPQKLFKSSLTGKINLFVSEILTDKMSRRIDLRSWNNIFYYLYPRDRRGGGDFDIHSQALRKCGREWGADLSSERNLKGKVKHQGGNKYLIAYTHTCTRVRIINQEKNSWKRAIGQCKDVQFRHLTFYKTLV